jgi:plastocyanin
MKAQVQNQGGVMGRLRIVAVVALLAFAAVACSDNTVTPSSGGTTPAGGSTTPAGGGIVNKGTADATAITGKQEIEGDDEGAEFYFKPTFIKVKGGQILSVDFKNEGNVPHNFSITSLAISKDIDAGKEIDFSITFPAAGGSDLVFFCRFHSTSGMQGAFFFGAAPSSSGGTTGGGTTGSGGSNSTY